MARMALPLIAAQLVNVLYNIVDRIYIGHIQGIGYMALTGVGIALPVITVVSAFAGLCGQGGAPLCSIARGRGDFEEASRVIGNALTLLLMAAVTVMTASLVFLKPILWAFGASEGTMPYAAGYLRIYLYGTPLVFISIGMNVYINAQGFATKGMLTVLIGAVANIILDPIFIFLFKMGVEGAALATVIAQGISAGWCLVFLIRKAPLELSSRTMKLRRKTVKGILALGVADFIVGITNSAIQTVANKMLGIYGGDLYIGAATVLFSLRTIPMEIIRGMSAGFAPVMGFNYGAGLKARVLKSIRCSAVAGLVFSTMVWIVFMTLPEPLIRLFTTDEELIRVAIPAVRIYFCGFVFMTLQFIAQNCFRALGKARESTIFSLFRKIVLVVPLTLLLPGVFGMGVNGVYWSEPISDIVGGAASFTTVMLTVYRPMAKQLKAEEKLCQN